MNDTPSNELPETSTLPVNDESHLLYGLNEMEIHQIAGVCHNINRAYCQSQGDDSQPEWVDAPDWQRDSAINGVRYHLSQMEKGIELSPSDSHTSWYDEKTLAGWTFGAVKDEVLKTHPCMLPYDELPASEKAKDYLFIQTVIELAD